MRLTPLRLGPGAPVLVLVLVLLLGDAEASPLLRPREAVPVTRRGCHLSARRAGPASRMSTSVNAQRAGQCAAQRAGFWLGAAESVRSRCASSKCLQLVAHSTLLAREAQTASEISVTHAYACCSAAQKWPCKTGFEGHSILVVRYGVQASAGDLGEHAAPYQHASAST